MVKYILVTGGVVSSLGKGVTAASLGRLLKSRGLSVAIQKLDPYLNVDPGTMAPGQHGEVFVTDDGAETDLDIGTYERFIDVDLTRASNVTTGSIYQEIITQERRGDFLGGTVQIVPHVTNAIKDKIYQVGKRMDAQVVIVEVGGTVGDIEGMPFLEAIRQMHRECGHENVAYVHVTLLPYISATDEVKTKPTQHSVNELRRVGIQPDVICCRSDMPVRQELRDKIALFCDVDPRAVISLPTVSSIYQVPLILEEAGLGDYLVEHLGLPSREPDLAEWRDLVLRIRAQKPSIKVALVGKYVSLKDAYLSVREALMHAALSHHHEVVIDWVSSEELEGLPPEGVAKRLAGVAGIVVPGGFGERGIEGKIAAARYARENKVPYLGLCLGMQVMVVEFARHVLGLAEANSHEFNPQTPDPVIALLPDQRDLTRKGGTMRLGLYACVLEQGSKAAAAYGVPVIYERHRHRYEFNNDYGARLAAAGLLQVGLSPDHRLVEICEIAGHPWMVGSQFHPEFRSRPNRPHPLFRDFIGAAIARAPHADDIRPWPREQRQGQA
jgi:CTP synthase